MAHRIVIAGGGIVGRALAIALTAQSHVTVRLVAGREGEPDARASAISAGARRLFGRLGVWAQMAADAEPVNGMRITDSASDDTIRPTLLHFDGDVDGSPFAHMVPNQTTRAALARRCGVLGIEAEPLTVTFYEERSGAVEIELSDGSVDRADILIAADGRDSRLRNIAGIGTVRRDYHQAGIAGTVAHEAPHDGLAVQHFLPNGPFAMLPLTGNRSSIVWTERPAFARSMAQMDPLLAGLEIERVFGLSLGRITVEDALQAYPLQRMIVRDWFAGRLAIAGDAAHVIHPLAGQGLNLGLRDVAVLAETLIESSRLGEDLALALPRYQKRRRADTAQMTGVTEGLNALFSRQSAALRAIRSIGLGWVDQRASLKALFMREAAGMEGETPRLMKGEAI